MQRSAERLGTHQADARVNIAFRDGLYDWNALRAFAEDVVAKSASEGEAQQPRTLWLGQIHAEQHDVCAGDRLDAERSVALLPAHRKALLGPRW